MSHIEDLALEIDYLRGDLAKRDAEIERLKELLAEARDDIRESVENEYPPDAAGEIERLQNRLFALGEMHKPPCFVCGYNGPNYYSPSAHQCAERHHALAGKPRA